MTKKILYNIYFLINPDMHLLDMAGPCQAFHEANYSEQLFNLHYVSFAPSITSWQGLQLTALSIPPKKLPDNSIVIVCASKYENDIVDDPFSNKSITWLQQVSKTDALIIGVCTGTFLLGKAGILNGLECTTHHTLTKKLAELYPKAQVKEDCIYVQSGNIYTTAGVTSGIDLCLKIIELLIDTQCSIRVARELVVHRRRMANDPQFSTHLSCRNHISPIIHSVQDYVSNHLNEKFTITDICKMFNISPRHLQRLFKEHTNITLRDYITSLRLAEAKSLLENSQTIEEAAYQAGFAQPASLREAWKKHYGNLPSSKITSQIKIK
jgi:transcriptional regulator GlxA family with amidase domain